MTELISNRSELKAILREDLATHKEDWKSCGFRALAVHRLGAYLSTISNPLVKKLAMKSYMVIYRWVRNHYGIEILYTVTIGRRVEFAHQHGIVVNHNAVIGDDCSLLQGVTIGANPDTNFEKAPTIGNRVFIAPGAVVTGDITIGDDVRILPNAVVMEDVPSSMMVYSHNTVLKQTKSR